MWTHKHNHKISAEYGHSVTAETNRCNGCEVDWDLTKLPREEAAKRHRLQLNVNGTVLTLCPDCAKKIREELFKFSAHW